MAKAKTQDPKLEPLAPEMIATLLAVNPAATRAWMALANESAQFMAESWQQGLDAQAAMLACKTPTEMMQVQAEFLTKSMAHYAEGATRAYTLMTGAANEMMTDARSGHKRKFDDVPI